MLSRATGYAVQLLIYLARKKGGSYFVRDIAEEIGVPPNFLSKIAVTLSKKGIIFARKGPKGGITLAKPPEKITLYDIAVIFDEDITKDKCLIGKPNCSDKTACPVHKFWKEERKRIIEAFKNTPISLLADGV